MAKRGRPGKSPPPPPASPGIFTASWWVDRAGNPPAPFTVITVEDIRAGRYRPVTPLTRARAIRLMGPPSGVGTGSFEN